MFMYAIFSVLCYNALISHALYDIISDHVACKVHVGGIQFILETIS